MSLSHCLPQSDRFISSPEKKYSSPLQYDMLDFLFRLKRNSQINLAV